jgi:Zn-dependent metalloprotease
VTTRFLSQRLTVLTVAATLGLAPGLASAIQPPADAGAIFSREFSAPELEAQPSLVSHEPGAKSAAGLAAMQGFFARSSPDWDVRWDERSNLPNLVQGVGVPILPGRGNKLVATGELKLADVEARVRGFIAQYPEMFGVALPDLKLNPAASTVVGAERQVWLIELQQTYRGVPVEGANVFFRINNGNIVQFGTDKVAPVRLGSVKPALDNAAALAAVLEATGFKLSELGEIVNPGTLKIVPTLLAGEKPAERFAGAAGTGYRHLLVWDLSFRRAGDAATWQALVDARTGRVLRFVDANAYAQVTGGIYPTTNTDPESVRGLPFANVTNGTAKTTDAAGNYTYSGGASTTTLNGKYFKMTDNCGAISLSDSSTGNLALGSGGGTDCTTPGVGGAGNTHASRTGYYHLTNINRKASGFLPGNAWLASNVTANMNINQTCNAFWNGTTVNFYRSGGGCSNTGEIAAVFLHEWGHGMDTNSGGAASDAGTGEAVGDTFAFLETKDPCIGQNFQPGVNCANCTACSGVRDVADFALGGSATIAKPANVASNTGINCDRYSCPYYQFVFIGAYQGPMGYEGHCESVIASSANWDLAQNLITRYGTTAGWAAMDSIWYKSLTPSKSAYRVASGGKCNPSAAVDGCGANNWYTVYLSVDDDDGNLANGTPNGCRIWDAFNAHGIACGSRPACTL